MARHFPSAIDRRIAEIARREPEAEAECETCGRPIAHIPEMGMPLVWTHIHPEVLDEGSPLTPAHEPHPDEARALTERLGV